MQVDDKHFDLFISEKEIINSIHNVASELEQDYRGKEILFLGILNGVFMFASDLIKDIRLDCEISFVKLSSYEGTQSTGKIKELIGLNTDLTDKHIIILEDIVDTGRTIDNIYSSLRSKNPKSIEVATLLYKKDAFQGKFPPKYVCISIPNEFIVGYGLDYNQKGRNLKNIYKIREAHS